MPSRTWVCPPLACRGLLENWITGPAAREGETQGAVTLLLSRNWAGFPAAEGSQPRPCAVMPGASPARERQDPSWSHFGGSLSITRVQLCCPFGLHQQAQGGKHGLQLSHFVISSEGQKTQQVPFPPTTVGAGLKTRVLSCFPACSPPRNITRHIHNSHLISASALSNDYEFAQGQRRLFINKTTNCGMKAFCS